MFIKSVAIFSIVAQSFAVGVPAETPDTQPTPSAPTATTEVSDTTANTPDANNTQTTQDSEVSREKVAPVSVTSSPEVMVDDPYAGVDRLARENVGVLADGVYTIGRH